MRSRLTAVVAIAFTLVAGGARAAERPNFIVIVADDLGYGDVSVHGATDVRTPHIDALAGQGLLFTGMRANATVCSPSRAALLTGRYPDRVGVPGVIRSQPENSWGYLDPAVPTLADAVKKAGYHTALVGKWHLGLESPNLPNERGFDLFHGFLGDMMDSYTTHERHGANLMRKNAEPISPAGHATDLFAAWAADYLRERARTPAVPFFLEIAFNAPHFPIQPPQEWLDRVRRRAPEMPPARARNVAFVEHLDDRIGGVLAALDETGLARSTFVVVTSDNGGSLPHAQSNAPWRGGKQSHYDGGLRVPFVVRWPAGIEPGRRSDHAGLLFDLFPTILELAGAPPAADCDAVSLVPLLSGGSIDGDRELYFVRREGGLEYGGKSYEAIIRGDWKLLQNDPYGPLELYNLRDDPQERNDLAATHKAEFEDLAKRLRRHIQRGGATPWEPPPKAIDLEAEFNTRVRPLLAASCGECHATPKPEADYDTGRFTDSRAVAAAWTSWQAAVDRIAAGEMPPADAAVRPTPAEREAIVAWTARFRRAEAERLRGDPGPTGIRRLNAAEYDATIRDLTAADIRPARDFPIDPANEAGFDNSAESLTMSPALVGKYLAAARRVVEHMLLTPDGIRFAAHPVVTDTDRDRYCVSRIVDFYRRCPTRIEDYLLACWRLRGRSADGDVAAAIEKAARDSGLSPKYLRTVWDALTDADLDHGPLAALRAGWRDLPADPAALDERRRLCGELAARVAAARKALAPQVANITGTAGVNAGSQPLVLWRNRRAAAQRRSCRFTTPEEALADEAATAVLAEADLAALRSGSDAERQAVVAACDRFCSVFPETFVVIERGREYLEGAKAAKAAQEGQGRLLSAGFHDMTGYFRDDRPLCELVLDDAEIAALDRLWNELDFITAAPVRQYTSFIWFERAETSFMVDASFAFVRAEDRDAITETSIRRLADAFLAKLKPRKPSAEAVQAVEEYFTGINRQIRDLERRLIAAEPAQVAALETFAARAFRRPLTAGERAAVIDSYRAARAEPASDHRTAMEDAIVSILVSPEFLHRCDLLCRSTEPQRLTDRELACRLSYFLWCTMPDERLIALASEGRLHDTDVLRAELRRMLADDRARDMVCEFVGNWLDCRRFDSHAGVDRGTFPVFDDALRRSMADEPLEYVLDLVRRDGRLMELVDSDHAIVDRRLAGLYGLDASTVPDDGRWHRVTGTRGSDRGGLLPMGVFLTQNSPGQRTSPVKRGYWVVRRLLGEHIPAPPADVPQLPASESQPGTASMRELLARHRADRACAGCHDRFDAAGLLLEGFDPVGRTRTVDLGGRPVDAAATLPDGTPANGLAGLRDYVSGPRREDFRRHFCASLLAFALGRSLVISDDLLVDEMLERLAREGDRIQVLFETIVTSPQFLSKRPATPPSGDTAHVAP